MPRLIAYDRVIDSAIALPGAMPASADEPIDWRVTVRRVENAEPFVATCLWQDDALHWSINPAEQHVVVDRHLTVQTTATADEQSVSENAIANGLPALGWIAGDVVMHAAAVVMPGSDCAIAIMAPSSGGKSTFLEQLMRAGADLLADDTLLLRSNGDHWIGSGLAGGWFMRHDGVSDRAFIPVPPGRSLRHARIGAFVWLRLTDEHPESITEHLHGIPALTALLSNRHRSFVARAIGSEAGTLRILSSIAMRVPIVALSRRRGDIGLTVPELAAMVSVISLNKSNP